MAKNDNPTTSGRPQPAKPLDPESQNLVAALTAAILAARQDAPQISQEASDAADEYAEIKAVLRTPTDTRPNVVTQQS